APDLDNAAVDENVEIGNSLTVPFGVIRPILSPRNSVNHRLPSGPAAISDRSLPGVGTVNSVIVPIDGLKPRAALAGRMAVVSMATMPNETVVTRRIARLPARLSDGGVRLRSEGFAVNGRA